MELKGSKTETNLAKAFAGEAQAMLKYLFYAEKAREEGYEIIAQTFEDFSRNEKEHAKIWFKFFKGILSNDENLKDAIAGEHYESTEMYVNFSKVAKEEGFKEISLLFDSVAAIEKGHEAKYKEFLGAEKLETMNWVCRKCGYQHHKKEAPSSCPVCEQYRVGGTN